MSVCVQGTVETFSSSLNIAVRKTGWLLSLPFWGRNDKISEPYEVVLVSPQTLVPPFAEHKGTTHS